jgi:predicted MFS family arabinose efflux permease
MSGVLLAGLLLASLRLPLHPAGTAASAHGAKVQRAHLPRRFWLFAGFAVLYGICETMNGNWSQSLMAHLGAWTTVASLALTTFWVMVTLGRVLFAAVQGAFPTTRTYHLLPFVLVGTFVLTALLSRGSTALGILTFGVAGLGCSALLPLTISFGEEQLVAVSAMAAGAIIAFYQLGYGIAAFGAGPLQSAGVGLSTIFGVTAVFALAMGGLSFVLARRPHRVSHLHPRPSLHAETGAG